MVRFTFICNRSPAANSVRLTEYSALGIMTTNLKNKNTNERVKEENLITEFTIAGSIDNLIDLLKDVVRENHFSLKPTRYYQKRGRQQSFQVLKEDQSTKQTFCCGAIEVIQRKENKVVVKFDSTRCSINEPQRASKETMERFFVAIVQRLMQMGMINKKNKG